jgi:hypothetical protein
VERKIELDNEDLDQIIEEYLRLHAHFDFDEIEIVNNRPNESRKLVAVFGLQEQLNDAIAFRTLTHLVVNPGIQHCVPKLTNLCTGHPIAKAVLK